MAGAAASQRSMARKHGSAYGISSNGNQREEGVSKATSK